MKIGLQRVYTDEMNKSIFEKLHHAKENYVIAKFLFFAGVGIIGTTGHYTVLIVLVQIGDIMPVYASTLGFSIGALINYILNYKYTFQCRKNHLEALIKFFIVALVGASINGVIMYIGNSWLLFNYILVQIFGTAIVVIITFILNALWTFAESEE